MRLDEFSSCPADSDSSCQGRSARPSVRFVPGRCQASEPCICEDTPSTRTAYLEYAGIQQSYRIGVPHSYTVLNGTVPGPGEKGKLGVHYVCFSVDGSNYAPVMPQILNQNEAAVNANSPLHFLFYDVQIYNTSMRQGPNNGQLVVRVLGSGFPLNDELRIEGGGGRIVPNEAVQVLIDQAMDSGGVTSAIQGYDKDVLILSENALEVTLPILTFPDGVLASDARLQVTFNSGADVSPKSDATTIKLFQLPTITG